MKNDEAEREKQRKMMNKIEKTMKNESKMMKQIEKKGHIMNKRENTMKNL